jgi:hypothetical protein
VALSSTISGDKISVQRRERSIKRGEEPKQPKFKTTDELPDLYQQELTASCQDLCTRYKTSSPAAVQPIHLQQAMDHPTLQGSGSMVRNRDPVVSFNP